MLGENTSMRLETAGNPADSGQQFAARVLVVDDEWLVRWAVSETLRARGFDVVEAADAQSALEALGSGCDLVLLDMPDAQNLGVLSRIRAAAPALPVIIMSAFMTPEIAQQATALGSGIVSKPFDLTGLAAAVERALNGRVY
ncbi:MAG TPA: response regulator [Vicinamibacterales bacterium]|jgi:DNA-binding NtrC family response regulator